MFCKKYCSNIRKIVKNVEARINLILVLLILKISVIHNVNNRLNLSQMGIILII